MKQFIILLLLVIPALTITAQQKVLVDNKGNYVVVHKVKDTASAIPSGKTFTDSKGKVWPVYLSVNGKPYLIRTSSKGNVYKQYLKVASN